MGTNIFRAVNSTLIYLERGDEYLMLHRTKKENDLNHSFTSTSLKSPKKKKSIRSFFRAS